MDTGDTITRSTCQSFHTPEKIVQSIGQEKGLNRLDIPDGKDAASLGETGFFGNTSNALFEDRGDLSGRSFVGIGP